MLNKSQQYFQRATVTRAASPRACATEPLVSVSASPASLEAAASNALMDSSDPNASRVSVTLTAAWATCAMKRADASVAWAGPVTNATDAPPAIIQKRMKPRIAHVSAATLQTKMIC